MPRAALRADGRGPARVPRRSPGIRPGGPGFWRSSVPGGRVRAAGPEPGRVPVALPAVARPEAGLRGVRRRGRSGMAAAVGAGSLPGSRMRVRQQDAGLLPGTPRTLPARRPPGPRRLGLGRTARDPAGSPGHLPGPRLRTVDLPWFRVLPRPRVRLEAARSPGPRRVRGRLRRRGETRPRPHQPAGSVPAAAPGMAVRVPGPQRRRPAEGEPGRGPAGSQLHRRRLALRPCWTGTRTGGGSTSRRPASRACPRPRPGR